MCNAPCYISDALLMLLTQHGCQFADNVELGTACGKLHRVSVLAITDAGETALVIGRLHHDSCF